MMLKDLNVRVLEQIAKIAFISYSINSSLTINPMLIEKHFSRKYGPNIMDKRRILANNNLIN
jgi:hypothetical protein